MNNSICGLFIKPLHGGAAIKSDSIELICGKGVAGDCFADGGLRQISLLLKSAADMLSLPKNADLPCVKRFTCNIIIDTDKKITDGTVIKIGTAQIKITQAGRACHRICESYPDNGCPLITQCFFGEVVVGGIIEKSDEVIIC